MIAKVFICISVIMTSMIFSKPWGVYQIYWGRGAFLKGLDRQIEILGETPHFVLFFRDLKRPFPSQALHALEDRNITGIVSLEITEWGLGRSNIRFLEKINQGDYDDFFKKWALDAMDFGGTVYLRYGFEMNGDWFSWGRQPELFKNTWRRIKRLFDACGAHNVKWMFCPNVMYGKISPELHFKPYYPGDSFVDCLGLDGYNFGDRHSEWHQWQTYEEIFEASIAGLSDFGKPIFIAEIGCADDERKTRWLENFLSRVERDERIEAFVYFNYDKRREKEPNWRIDSDEHSLRVFKTWIKNQ